MDNIPACFYRISVKALVLNEEKDKFLITKESNGWWELPGGGLDWGEKGSQEIAREISEEMNLRTTRIAENPSYFFTFKNKLSDAWMANIVYTTELESLNFTPSDECTEINFINANNTEKLQLSSNVLELLKIFNQNNH